MSAAPANTHDAKDPAPRDPERGRLLGLVRKLIDYGCELVATLRNHGSETPPLRIARHFGAVSVALIITRITRGLMIAAALEARLRRPTPRVVARTPSAEPRAKRAPNRPRIDEEAELHGDLPSAREIAARIRKCKTGAVIVEICRDLGIDTLHPLWRDIRDAIMFHGGRMANMMKIWMRRSARSVGLPLLPEKEETYHRLMAALAQPP